MLIAAAIAAIPMVRLNMVLSSSWDAWVRKVLCGPICDVGATERTDTTLSGE